MQVYKQEDIEKLFFENTAVAFGYFDGVHIGHKAILKKLKETGLKTIVVVFGEKGKVLSTDIEKEYLISQEGIDVIIFVEFDFFDKLHSENKCFMKDFVLSKLGAKKILIGENGAIDKIHLTKHLMEKSKIMNFELVVVDNVKVDGEVVSKDKIINAISVNDTKKMIELLGGSYIIIGKVIHGKGNGKKYNMPTANLFIDSNKILPPQAVYGTISIIDDEEKVAVTNIGKRPTIDNMNYITIESFIDDYNKDCYDKIQILKIFMYIRDIIKMNNLTEVKQQIDIDIITAKNFYYGNFM